MMRLRRKEDTGPVHRITGARQSLADDVRGRQRRYIISMGIRSVSVVLTVLLWNVSPLLAWITLALGVVLPYVAVVIANAGRENPPSIPSTFLAGDRRPALPPADSGGLPRHTAGPH
ncbi:DUF3099 domain-containing protein [Streptomyces sodiiphilus]|uniref:DUF3099 domain-containing protein n=1 Tax=Streptomyces sodiiphilus TaxID=226217 RepID=A0ABN2PD96_9ACTN